MTDLSRHQDNGKPYLQKVYVQKATAMGIMEEQPRGDGARTAPTVAIVVWLRTQSDEPEQD